MHYSFQTVVQWSKFEIPHQLIHILNIDKTKIFTSIDHRRMTKDELSFSAPIWMEEQSLRISESSSGIVFYGTTWYSSYSSGSFQLLSVTYTQIHSGFIAGRVKVFKTSTSLSRLSLSCSLVSNSRWRLAVFSTSDLRFCVMTVSSFKYWLEW